MNRNLTAKFLTPLLNLKRIPHRNFSSNESEYYLKVTDGAVDPESYPKVPNAAFDREGIAPPKHFLP